MATGLRDVRAFSTAVAATCLASMSPNEVPSLHAHPEPVPSVERTVAVIVTFALESYANSPFELASAVAPARHSMKPVAMRSFARANSVTCLAANARSAGVGNAITRSRSAGYVCAPNSGIRSGLGGTSFAISVACFAAAASDASSNRFVCTLALRFPTYAVMVTFVSRFSPDVVT